MMSAVTTSDEIAAAAVARGIDNPGKKTSVMTLHLSLTDYLAMLLVTVWTGIVIMAG